MSHFAQPSGDAFPLRPTAGDHPEVEPLASILEYGKRLECRHTWMMQQLRRLDDRSECWIVVGPARIESWHVGAVVIGPPGIFLVWPEATRPEPALWQTMRECRAHVQSTLGESAHAAVEIVLYSPSHERGTIQRWMDSEDDVLTAHGTDLDRLLAEWHPITGMTLSEQWLARLQSAAEPREWLYGPDRGAHLHHPRWSATGPGPAG